MIPRLLISAAHKSSGKTTVSLGLCAALARDGLRVQPFKKGPDYIDPMWLAKASGRACYNLDFNTMGPAELHALFRTRAEAADLALVEGNKGLYDGLDLEGSNSNAALARLLALPVLLVIDTRGMTRGIAPLLLGYQEFDDQVRIAGVVLNQTGGPRHESKLVSVVEHYTDIPVVGCIRRDSSLGIRERHLGLVPSNELGAAERRIRTIADRVGEQLDLALVRQLATAAPALPAPATRLAPETDTPHWPLRVAVARDEAFGFYYADDLEAFERAGAELRFFDSLRDQRLPAADALFIGGGFPETAMDRLAANEALRRAIREAIEAGLPTYAECGGLMYLTRSIRWGERQAPMVGALPADTLMSDRPAGKGYVVLEPTADHPWPGDPATRRLPLPAHEFHYSRLENLAPGARFAYRVVRGAGIDGQRDGLVHRNLLACYAHLRHSRRTPWVHQFLAFAAACRQRD